MPVLTERTDLLPVEVGQEHAGQFLALTSCAISIRTSPLGGDDVPGVDEGFHSEMNVFLSSGRSCPIVVDCLAADNRLSKWVYFVVGVAREKACGKVGIVSLPRLFVFSEEMLRVSCAELGLALWLGFGGLYQGSSLFHEGFIVAGVGEERLVIRNYAIVGQTLWSFSEKQGRRILLSELPLYATAKLNEERGVEFRLPTRQKAK